MSQEGFDINNEAGLVTLKEEMEKVAQQHHDEEAFTKEKVDNKEITMTQLEIHHFIARVVDLMNRDVCNNAVMFNEGSLRILKEKTEDAMLAAAGVYDMSWNEIKEINTLFEEIWRPV